MTGAIERARGSEPNSGAAVLKQAQDCARLFLYFSELLGRQVMDSSGRPAGLLSDFKVRLGDLFPRVSSILVRKKMKLREMDWAGVDRLDGRVLRLRPEAERTARPPAVANDEILLREDILDKQVVDTFGAKIKRVNDIHLLSINSELRLVHVDYGTRGLLRRLGWLRVMESVSDWLFGYRPREMLLSWKYIQPLASDLQRKNLKTNLTLRRLHEIHPSDLADILEDLDQESRKRIFHSLDLETAAETLQELEPKLQRTMLETTSAEKASDILEEMEPDEATDILSDLPEEKQRNLIRGMERPAREKIEVLLRFEEGTAGSLMTTDHLSLGEGGTIGRAVEVFKATDLPLDSASYLYVTDDAGRLVGVLTLRHLFLNDVSTPVRELMNPHLVSVSPETDVDEVLDLFRKYKFMALPVVDAERRLCGIITLKDILGRE